MQNVDQTLLSQYANSPTLSSLVEAMNQWIDPQVNIAAFYADIWNVATAVGYGLDVWGKIVGVPRALTIATSDLFFGFNEAFGTGLPNNPQPFNTAPFYSGQSTTTTFPLDDNTYRALIYAKALANITNCTAASLNALLSQLFGTTGVTTIATAGTQMYVIDNNNMTFTIKSTQPINAITSAILASPVIPRPPGVSFTVTT